MILCTCECVPNMGVCLSLSRPISLALPPVAVVCFLLSALGITAGAHRLWSHKSYKASTPLRVFLALANSMAFQVNKGKLY